MTRAVPQVGPFELCDELASGGSAQVFRARYRVPPGGRRELWLPPDAPVVLKVLRSGSEVTRGAWEAFHTEAELLVMLDHPGLVRAITRGTTEGRVWIALEYVEGEDLRSLVHAFAAAGLRLKPELAVTLLSDVCAGLAAAHALVDACGMPLGLVHRDVSARNVLLDIEGQGRLLDFGSVLLPGRRVSAGPVEGTPGYLSPEQARGEELTQASDVYALGILLFELLTATRAYPLEAVSDATLLDTHGAGRRAPWPEDLALPAGLRAVVDDALALDPGARPKDAAALYHRLAPFRGPDAMARRALRLVAYDLVRTNAERPPPFFV